MKKLLAIAFAASLILSGCTVGPREDSIVTSDQDASQTGDIASGLTDVSMTTTETLPVCTATTTSEADVFASTTISDVLFTEPVTTSVTSYEPVTTPEPNFEVIEYDEPFTLYSTISLNVRSGPSTDYESIGALSEGQGVNVVGYVEDAGWYMIEFKNGFGYVSGYYMTSEDPNPPAEEDYPQLDPLDHAEMSTIISDFAKLMNVDEDSVVLAGYYGDCNAGEAVLLYSTELAYTDDENIFTVAGYEFELPSGDYSISIHTGRSRDNNFVDIEEAYESGMITKKDVAKFHHYFKERQKLTQWNPQSPTSGEITADAQQKLIDDYLATLSDEARKEALEFGGAFVAKYYGTYTNGEVVLMSYYGQITTEALTTVTVAGNVFHFNNGNNNICLHYGDEFIPLADAHARGLITTDEVRQAHSFDVNPDSSLSAY